MENKWLIIHAKNEFNAKQIKKLLKKQGVYDTHFVLIHGDGVSVNLDGKDITASQEQTGIPRHLSTDESVNPIINKEFGTRLYGPLGKRQKMHP